MILVYRKKHPLTAFHIPGISNVQADILSRTGNEDLEWALEQFVFDKFLEKFPDMNLDLFTSRLNAKLTTYVSRYPEPGAFAVDAFSLSWNDELLYYVFPPFSLIARILQKLEEDGSRAIMIAPIWPTQVWWPNLVGLIQGQCFILPKNTLRLMHKPDKKHPLKKMQLAAFHILGRP